MKRHRLISLLAAAVALAALPTRAHARFTFTLSQVGANVTINGSGTINTTGLTSPGAGNSGGAFEADTAYIRAGLAMPTIAYLIPQGPTSFGPGENFVIATTSTGSPMLIDGSNSYIFLPSNYVSGSALANTTTFNNQTFATLGFTPGTYTYNLGNGDSLVVTSGVPEPSTWAAVAAGAGLLGCASLRRRARAC